MPVARDMASEFTSRLVTAIAIVCFVLLPVRASQGENKSPLTYFYKTNDLDSVPTLIRNLDADGTLAKRSARPPTIGFLAALFERNPDRIDGWIAGEFGTMTHWVIAMSLDIAGHHDQAVAFAHRHNLPPKAIGHLHADRDGLLSLPVHDGATLDVMWGASFATGDPRYVDRVIDFVDEAVRSGAYPPEDILSATALVFGGDREDIVAHLKARYADRELMQIIYVGTALWSLSSNAKQHEFVRAAAEKRAAAMPNSTTVRLIRDVVLYIKH